MDDINSPNAFASLTDGIHSLEALDGITRAARRMTHLSSTMEPKIFLDADDSQSMRDSYSFTCAPSCFW